VCFQIRRINIIFLLFFLFNLRTRIEFFNHIHNVKIWIKNPGSTGWRDISTDYPPSTSGIELNDNVGARQGTQPSNLGGGGGTATFTINLVTEGLASQGYFVIRIQASQNWAGRINSITISGLS
jgi:hypothetical protein